MLKLGEKSIKSLYLGGKSYAKAYLGSKLVFNKIKIMINQGSGEFLNGKLV